ncbi:MAG TPA: class I SAM-dependent methyltransferase [Candidatus Binatia bacterium]|jgi:ubiquinone/menaquinone biosynthesis C-methylase UbiE|nr:class I SAM-dependent methyltransferase [Candidatus Binatia bacterium]
MSDLYLDRFRGVQGDREAIYAEIYKGSHIGEEEINKLPSRRRQKRIHLYKSIIGKGHEQILEIGCGLGDLTSGLAENARRVVGTDVSARNIEVAKIRMEKFFRNRPNIERVEFHRMGATNIKCEDGTFDWVVSTSLIEHLHPDDIQPHLKEVVRVLKPGGRYLVWAPNRLGHHEDRDFHLSMFSYRELVGEMTRAGFKKFYTTFFNFSSLVNAGFKNSLETWMTALRIKAFWSHLGVRNILLVAEK